MSPPPLATLLEDSFADLKIAPRAPYKVPPIHLPILLAPQFPGFHPFFKKFLKIFSPS